MASLYGYLAVAFAGVAITALLTSLTSGVSLLDPAALNRYRFWAAGSLAGQDTGVVVRVLLHDLNQAGRYADHVIAMRDGAIVAEGAPAEVITPATVAEVFDLTCQVTTDPVSGTPLVIPIGRHHGTEPVSSRSQAV
jgi:ABC-type cobalamin/Fe3+-siderophores transport system ATPase subunit